MPSQKLPLKIILGDCRDALAGLPSNSVQTVLTSPPYFNLRDYGEPGQIGREATPEEYIHHLVRLFRQVRRVLRDDGTVWLNLGDGYAGGNNSYGVIKPKDLIGMPWMVALALRADGWWLRQDIVWAKPNPMAESISDRCTKSHEYIFLLAKSGKPTIWRAVDTGEWTQHPDHRERIKIEGHPEAPPEFGSKQNGRYRSVKRAEVTKPAGVDIPRWQGFSYYFDQEAVREHLKLWNQGRSVAPAAGAHRPALGTRVDTQNFYQFNEVKGANRRSMWSEDSLSSIWSLITKPVNVNMAQEAGAEFTTHYATWPLALPAAMILAGSPPGATVLDPFGGSGSTAVAAAMLGRGAILCELSPDYAEGARARVANSLGLSAKDFDGPTIVRMDNGPEQARPLAGGDDPARPRKVGGGKRPPAGA